MEDLTRVMARKLLCEGKHVEAVKAALFSLRFLKFLDNSLRYCLFLDNVTNYIIYQTAFRFSIDNHGLNSVSLVPSYLTLNEASIGE